MTPDEKRIAIAEACGWVWYRTPRVTYETCEHRCLFLPEVHEYEGQSAEWLIRADGTERICNMAYMEREGHLPNYLEDANAMSWAEQSLLKLGNKGHEYILHLWEVTGLQKLRGFLLLSRQSTGADFHTQIDKLWELWIVATPSHRADAFLRTIGKLKD